MPRIILIPFWFLITGLLNILPVQGIASTNSSPEPEWSQWQSGVNTRPAGLTTVMAAQRESAEPDQPVVRAVMFWLDTCGHCHYVLENVLPPLQAEYGRQFEITLIELVSTTDVDRLYNAAAELGFSRDQVRVPFLIIGDRVLIGSDQVETELPGLIASHLAAGGVDFPAVASLEDLYPGSPAGQTDAVSAIGSTQTPGEQIGFILANTILVGMLAALAYSVVVLLRGAKKNGRLHSVRHPKRPNPLALPQRTREGKGGLGSLAIPILAILGLGVSAYLAYVETQAVPAVCGPIGDCNAVQSSPYARLFGVLPVGVLGLLGYGTILAARFMSRFGGGQLARYASLAVLGMAFAGTLFSIYLTYLEPYVIGAVCAWCLTSAILITVLLLLSLGAGREALDKVR